MRDDFRKRSDGKPFVKTFLTDLKVGLLKIHPNMSEQEFAAYAGYDGLLLEGTGIGGHVPLTKTDDDTGEHEMIGTAIRHLIDTGTVVAAATQTIYGVVNMRVYSTGRKMLGLGIIGDGCDMHPETAFIKLAWLLSNYPKGEVKRLFEKNLKGEISSVRPLVDSHTE